MTQSINFKNIAFHLYLPKDLLMYKAFLVILIFTLSSARAQFTHINSVEEYVQFLDKRMDSLVRRHLFISTLGGNSRKAKIRKSRVDNIELKYKVKHYKSGSKKEKFRAIFYENDTTIATFNTYKINNIHVKSEYFLINPSSTPKLQTKIVLIDNRFIKQYNYTQFGWKSLEELPVMKSEGSKW